MGTIHFRILSAAICAVLLAAATPVLAEQNATVEILVTKANFAIKEKNYDEALKAAEEALRRDAGNTKALALKGRALVELNRTEEALKVFADLEKKAPADDSWRLGYGIVLQKSGDNKGAIKQLERALKADPGPGAAHYHLAYALYSDKQFSKAEPHFTHAIERDFNTAAAYYYRGRCAYESGKAGSAKSDFQTALDKGAQGELAQKARAALELVQEFEAQPGAAEEEKPLRLDGRVGVAYDSNVTVSPDDGSTPTAGGFITKEDDFRLELDLNGEYRTEMRPDLDFFIGYSFQGFFQFGIEDKLGAISTEDFTLLNQRGTLGFNHAADNSNNYQLRFDYLHSTIGRLRSTENRPDTIGQEILSQQLIITGDWVHALSNSMSVNPFLQYSHDYREEDAIGPLGGFGGLDADTLEPGVRLISALSDRDGWASVSLSWYSRFNEGGGPASVNKTFRYTGPRFRAVVESVIPEISDQFTLSATLLLAYEHYYDFEPVSSTARKDFRAIGTAEARYDLTDNVATSLSYRGEGLISNASPDPGYDRHVVSLNLIFEN